jgi:hypothetical protein
MATPPKITLDELIAHPDHAYGLQEQQVRDTLKEIAERTAALKTLETEMLWRLVAEHLAVPESWGPRASAPRSMAQHSSWAIMSASASLT